MTYVKSGNNIYVKQFWKYPTFLWSIYKKFEEKGKIKHICYGIFKIIKELFKIVKWQANIKRSYFGNIMRLQFILRFGY